MVELRKKTTGMIISEQDEIAWLFNLRGEGGSIQDTISLEGSVLTSLFQCLALVTLDSIILWLHEEMVSDEIRSHLNQDNCAETNMCVVIKEFSNFIPDLTVWAADQTKVS